MTFLTEFFGEFRNVCISHRFIIIDFLMHLKINGTLNVYYRCKLWIKLNEKKSKPGTHFFFLLCFSLSLLPPDSLSPWFPL